MQHCIEKTDWEGVISEAEKQGDVEPTRSIIMMRNIALSRLGRQCEEMYNFPWGRKIGDPNVPYDMLNVAFSKTIFYHYGLLNDCHRKCMEDGVEYGWKVEFLQYLARCSILSGEKAAATKALNQLRHTMYYREWADSMQVMLDNPQQVGRDRETEGVLYMMQYKDALGMDEGNADIFRSRLFSPPSVKETRDCSGPAISVTPNCAKTVPCPASSKRRLISSR